MCAWMERFDNELKSEISRTCNYIFINMTTGLTAEEHHSRSSTLFLNLLALDLRTVCQKNLIHSPLPPNSFCFNWQNNSFHFRGSVHPTWSSHLLTSSGDVKTGEELDTELHWRTFALLCFGNSDKQWWGSHLLRVFESTSCCDFSSVLYKNPAAP